MGDVAIPHHEIFVICSEIPVQQYHQLALCTSNHAQWLTYLHHPSTQSHMLYQTSPVLSPLDPPSLSPYPQAGPLPQGRSEMGWSSDVVSAFHSFQPPSLPSSNLPNFITFPYKGRSCRCLPALRTLHQHRQEASQSSLPAVSASRSRSKCFRFFRPCSSIHR